MDIVGVLAFWIGLIFWTLSKDWYDPSLGRDDNPLSHDHRQQLKGAAALLFGIAIGNIFVYIINHLQWVP